MGKFSGILLASDWDGTICSEMNICKENIDAINYFKSEGGLFTICSGRHYTHFDLFKDRVEPNTHLITLNGALIVDNITNEVLHEGFLTNEYIKIIEELYVTKELFQQLYIWEKGAKQSLELTKDSFAQISEALKSKKIYKVLLASDSEDNALNCTNYVNSLNIKSISASRSWKYSMELINPGNDKGKALKWLANSVGAKMTVAVGDYENDISMLDEADLSFAPIYAPLNVQEHADALCNPVMEGSIASVIQALEERINNNSALF